MGYTAQKPKEYVEERAKTFAALRAGRNMSTPMLLMSHEEVEKIVKEPVVPGRYLKFKLACFMLERSKQAKATQLKVTRDGTALRCSMLLHNGRCGIVSI